MKILHLVRKSLSEPTVAANVLKHGTGALNIDACRIGGRWPANLILEHLPECRCVGTKKVSGTGVAVQRNRDGDVHNQVYGSYRKPAGEDQTYADTNGLETVDAWDCAPGCPVADLDAQSGDVRSAGNYPSTSTRSDNHIYSARKGQQGQLYADKGGASRFFKQICGKK